MDEQLALEAITITAARLCGADAILGSIEPGKIADLALFSHNPLEFRSRTRLVLLQGRIAFQCDSPDLSI